MAALDIQIAEPAAESAINLDPAKLDFGTTFAPNWFIAEYREGTWRNARVEPLRNIPLHPAAVVLHYAQAVFEGMKAYRWASGRIALFRPAENARRFNRSADRMSMPPVPEDFFVQAVKTLVHADAEWIPREPGSLYIRPTIIATEASIGVHSAHEFLFYILGLPSGAYFKEAGPGGAGTVTVYVVESSSRAAHGGTGGVKAAANYAISLRSIEEGKRHGCSQVLFLDSVGKREVEELGGMNVFFVERDTLLTPPLHDTILPGITRDSILTLAPDLGLAVREEPIRIDDTAAKIENGEITEVFACGTAAVVAGIGELLFESGRRLTIGNGSAGRVTRMLNREIQGIQFGRIEDRHRWMEAVS